MKWYADKSLHLGNQFADHFQEALDKLATQPSAYHKVRTVIRRLNMNRFPYALFFKINEANQQVDVLALLHEK